MCLWRGPRGTAGVGRVQESRMVGHFRPPIRWQQQLASPPCSHGGTWWRGLPRLGLPLLRAAQPLIWQCRFAPCPEPRGHVSVHALCTVPPPKKKNSRGCLLLGRCTRTPLGSAYPAPPACAAGSPSAAPHPLEAVGEEDAEFQLAIQRSLQEAAAGEAQACCCAWQGGDACNPGGASSYPNRVSLSHALAILQTQQSTWYGWEGSVWSVLVLVACLWPALLVLLQAPPTALPARVCCPPAAAHARPASPAGAASWDEECWEDIHPPALGSPGSDEVSTEANVSLPLVSRGWLLLT